MAFKVLVVDDSVFYRRRLKAILQESPDLTVIGEASNGREAITQVKTLKPDVVTMDIEMPILDGISAVKTLMQTDPVPILMFSSLTHEGAQATLDALEAGALDFLPKNFEDISLNNAHAIELLRTKVRLVAKRKPYLRAAGNQMTSQRGVDAPKSTFIRASSVLSGIGTSEKSEQLSVSSVKRSGKRYKCLAIGASTGGPVALQKVLTQLPASFPVPIVIVQHMPATFTKAFAQRLNGLSKIEIIHAEDGMVAMPGKAYIAPGGKQCELHASSTHVTFTIRETTENDNVSYKPSVDIAFKSIAKSLRGDVLGLILTGMGADGQKGCELLKQYGATIWAQDQNSCVVYGMPQAVASAGISSQSIGLDNIASCLITEMGAA